VYSETQGKADFRTQGRGLAVMTFGTKNTYTITCNMLFFKFLTCNDLLCLKQKELLKEYIIQDCNSGPCVYNVLLGSYEAVEVVFLMCTSSISRTSRSDFPALCHISQGHRIIFFLEGTTRKANSVTVMIRIGGGVAYILHISRVLSFV
jgi:hypothetical protein